MSDSTYTTMALVLSKHPAASDDALITCQTPSAGQLSLWLRGGQKFTSKMSGHLEPLNLTEVMVVHGRAKDYVGAAVSRACFARIKNDERKLAAAAKIVEVLRLTGGGEQDGEVFALAIQALNLLETAPNLAFYFDNLAVLSSLAMLIRLGHCPDLNFCPSCGLAVAVADNLFQTSGQFLVCQVCLNFRPTSFVCGMNERELIHNLSRSHWSESLKLWRTQALPLAVASLRTAVIAWAK